MTLPCIKNIIMVHRPHTLGHQTSPHQSKGITGNSSTRVQNKNTYKINTIRAAKREKDCAMATMQFI